MRTRIAALGLVATIALCNQRAVLLAEGQESGHFDTARYRNLLQDLDGQVAAPEAWE